MLVSTVVSMLANDLRKILKLYTIPNNPVLYKRKFNEYI